jgi:hypothetical protein
MLAGVVGCGTQNGYCVVIHEQYQLESNATTIYHATTSQPTTTVPVNVPVVGTSTVNGLINQIIQFFNELFKKL